MYSDRKNTIGEKNSSFNGRIIARENTVFFGRSLWYLDLYNFSSEVWFNFFVLRLRSVGACVSTKNTSEMTKMNAILNDVSFLFPSSKHYGSVPW